MTTPVPTGPRPPRTALFAASLVRPRHRRIALVASPADAETAWRARVPAVAAYGLTLTADQVAVLRDLGAVTVVVLFPDTPDAEAAVYRVRDQVGDHVHVCVGEWRAYWLCDQVADLTPDRLRKMHHSARPFPEWAARRAIRRRG